MAIALITGSSGLIGSESAEFFHEKGYEILGIESYVIGGIKQDVKKDTFSGFKL